MQVYCTSIVLLWLSFICRYVLICLALTANEFHRLAAESLSSIRHLRSSSWTGTYEHPRQDLSASPESIHSAFVDRNRMPYLSSYSVNVRFHNCMNFRSKPIPPPMVVPPFTVTSMIDD
jgi:hypothetical protein